MKQAFETYVKPANDRLGRLIASPKGIKTIEVEVDNLAQMVPVYVVKRDPNGGKIWIPSDKLRSMDALGLSIRSSL